MKLGGEKRRRVGAEEVRVWQTKGKSVLRGARGGVDAPWIRETKIKIGSGPAGARALHRTPLGDPQTDGRRGQMQVRERLRV